ncbi:ras-related protein RabX-like [Condylostylus longicornis]|uniref:ras-related protein RabX-like n=1 Tax=Condylostylus longicornis TaxID=2530218 RepID=UPI00244DB745|nr:ras-related protein RabX-like [Condylostylus longicornis]
MAQSNTSSGQSSSAAQPAAQHPKLSLSLDPMKYISELPEFGGKSHELFNFIGLVENIIPIVSKYDENGQIILLNKIKSKLVGKAREIVEINNHVSIWSEIKTILINNFGEKKTTLQIYEELQCVKFTSTPVDLYNQIKHILRRYRNNNTNTYTRNNSNTTGNNNNNITSYNNNFMRNDRSSNNRNFNRSNNYTNYINCNSYYGGNNYNRGNSYSEFRHHRGLNSQNYSPANFHNSRSEPMDVDPSTSNHRINTIEKQKISGTHFQDSNEPINPVENFQLTASGENFLI